MNTKTLFIVITTLLFVSGVQAAPLSYWGDNGYQMIASDDGVGDRGFVNPGWGGQDFDAEYLFYRYDKDAGTLTLGLQTGFDLVDGHVRWRGHDFYAGDLVMTFDQLSGQQFAIDFGLYTRDSEGDEVDAGTGTGVDAAGVYQVSNWNNDINYTDSGPFAMDDGVFLASVNSTVGYDLFADSYYRTVTFSYAELGLQTGFNFSAHWTMSCGNDVVAGTGYVPVPGGLPLLGLGLAVIVWARRQKNK